MKLKKWIKAVDPLIDVVIWTQDDNESPSFEGSMFDSIDLTNDELWLIGNKAFNDCKKLGIVRIPETVTDIANDAFNNCNSPVIICTVGSAAYHFARMKGFEYILE